MIGSLCPTCTPLAFEVWVYLFLIVFLLALLGVVITLGKP